MGKLLDRDSFIDIFRIAGVASFFGFLERFDSFSSASNHIVSRVELILPIYDLIHAERHGRPYLCCDGWRLYRSNDFMLEFSYYFVDKENRGSGGEHTHGNVIESESSCTVLADLYAVSLTVDRLDLLLFRKRRRGVLSFQQLGLKDVLSLISNRKIYKLTRSEFIGDFNREFYLLIE